MANQTNQENQEKLLYRYVNSKINSIVKSCDESYIRASLAQLRRGVGKRPGSLPDIWDLTLKDLPETSRFKTDEPTWTEWAVHLAMTLFALHQQGRDPQTKPMSVSGESLGYAVRNLRLQRGEASEDAIKRRFDTVVTSDSPEELTHHLRGLIQLLKSEAIPLDYPQLAVDFYQFQSPEKRDRIRLKWGRDYFTNRKEEGIQNE